MRHDTHRNEASSGTERTNANPASPNSGYPECPNNGQTTTQHNTTNDGRIDRRAYLKTFGVAGLAAGMVGIAGCLGAEAERSGSGGSSGVSGNDGESGASGGAQNGSSADSNAETETDARNDGDSGATGNGASGFKTYTNSEHGYSLDYPADWEVSEGDPEESESVQLEGSDGSDVSVDVAESNGQTAKGFADGVISAFGDRIEVVSREEMALSSGQNGHFFEYKINSDETEVVTQTKVLYVIADENFYEIEAESGSVTGIDEETSQLLDEIMASFTIGK